ncbi:hypothetical protein BDQ17DRAFT_1493261 [Cyathus striatus]|nr:hypothetical protein BDQ17DRAFT_1493261 [Cyathus striatus]
MVQYTGLLGPRYHWPISVKGAEDSNEAAQGEKTILQVILETLASDPAQSLARSSNLRSPHAGYTPHDLSSPSSLQLLSMDPYNPKNPSYVDPYTPSLKLHQIRQTNSSTPDRAVNILYDSSPLTPHSPTRIIVLTTSNTILLNRFTFQVFPLVCCHLCHP